MLAHQFRLRAPRSLMALVVRQAYPSRIKIYNEAYAELPQEHVAPYPHGVLVDLLVEVGCEL